MSLIFILYQVIYLNQINQLEHKIDTNVEFRRIVALSPTKDDGLIEVPVSKNILRLVFIIRKVIDVTHLSDNKI